MVINKKGIDLIKQFEGFRNDAYLCPANIWTIGYGNTRGLDGKPIKKGDKITKEDAEKLLIKEVNEFANGVKKLLKVKLNENQFSALVSFAYNVGLGNLKNSTLLKLVNILPNSDAIYTQFLRWTKANGKELMGLKTRRVAEANLYFS